MPIGRGTRSRFTPGTEQRRPTATKGGGPLRSDRESLIRSNGDIESVWEEVLSGLSAVGSSRPMGWRSATEVSIVRA